MRLQAGVSVFMNNKVANQTEFRLTFKELTERFERCSVEAAKQNEVNVTTKIVEQYFPEFSPIERQHLLTEYLHLESSPETDDLTAFHEACKGLLGDRLDDSKI